MFPLCQVNLMDLMGERAQDALRQDHIWFHALEEFISGAKLLHFPEKEVAVDTLLPEEVELYVESEMNHVQVDELLLVF